MGKEPCFSCTRRVFRALTAESAFRGRAASLTQCDHAVRLTTLEALPLTARPLYFDAIVRGRIRKSEVQPRIVLGQEARSGLHFAGKPPAPHINIHSGADRIPIV